MLGKIVTLLIWAACVLAVVVPLNSPFYEVGYWTFIALACAHAIECVVFASRVMKAPGNKLYHFAMVLVFGVFHANTLPK